MRRITFGIILILFLIGISTLVRANNGGNIDVYTERGGKGPNVSSGPFMVGEKVVFYAKVTYNNWPEQNNLVSFVICDSREKVYRMFIGILTNSTGVASESFIIPTPDSHANVLGTWSVTASTTIAQCNGEHYEDTVTFEVNPIQQVVPEVPLGTIMSSAAMIIALVAYVAVRALDVSVT